MAERILIVDDDPETTRSLAELLQRKGYVVRQENDSVNALAAAREMQPHAVILDYLMPRAHGGDVAWQLASDPLLRDVRIVICSGVAPADIKTKLPPSGIPILGKPVDFDALVDLISDSGTRSTSRS